MGGIVASAIAYSMMAFFLACGVFGLYRIGAGQISASREPFLLCVSFAFIAAAWGCAYLGGI